MKDNSKHQQQQEPNRHRVEESIKEISLIEVIPFDSCYGVNFFNDLHWKHLLVNIDPEIIDQMRVDREGENDHRKFVHLLVIPRRFLSEVEEHQFITPVLKDKEESSEWEKNRDRSTIHESEEDDCEAVGVS